MNKKELVNKLFPYFLVLVAVVLRLLPHPANFAPVAALALFGGVYLSKKTAILIPLAALGISDYFLGYYSFGVMLSVWGSFLLVGLIGLFIRKRKSITKIIVGTLSGSILFFVITNFAVWFFSNWYEKTFSGLVKCFYLALPFFRNSLLGDIFYVGVFFGTYELVLYLNKEKERNLIKVKNE